MAMDSDEQDIDALFTRDLHEILCVDKFIGPNPSMLSLWFKPFYDNMYPLAQAMRNADSFVTEYWTRALPLTTKSKGLYYEGIASTSKEPSLYRLF